MNFKTRLFLTLWLAGIGGVLSSWLVDLGALLGQPVKELITAGAGKLLFWFDDDNRIDMTLPVIFSSGVGRIEQSHAINQKSIGVLAGG